MQALALFCLVVWLGWQVVGLLPLHVSKSERFALAGVFGMVLSTWLMFLLSCVLGYQIGLGVSLVSMLGVCLVIWRYPGCKQLVPTQEILPKSGWRQWLFLVICTAALGFAAYLLVTHMLPVQSDGSLTSSGYTWSDIALHSTLISAFAHQNSLSLVFPIYPQASLSYPFLVDFFSGMLMRFGASLTWSLLIPNALLTFAVLRLLLFVGHRMLGSWRAAFIHMALVLASGSPFGFIQYLRDVPTLGWAAYNQIDYANYDAANLHFANFVTSHLLPQRSYLFGFAVVLAAILVLLQLKKQRRLAVALVTLAGLLPLIHVHSFFVLFGVLVIYTLWSAIKKHGSDLLIWLLAGVLVVAVPQVLWQFFTTFHDNFIMHHVGWFTVAGESVWVFWLRNGGLALPLLLLALIWYRRHISALMGSLVLMGALLFLAGNLYSFQPNLWDNMKFFTYGYVFLCLPIAGWLALGFKRVFSGIVVSAVIASLAVSGVLSLMRETSLKYEVESAGDVVFADLIDATLPHDAVILTTDRHNHPIPVLAGRRIVLGHGGWLWSYGINATETAYDVQAMWAGGDAALELLHKHGVTHVAFHDNEVWSQHINVGYFQAHFTNVLQYGGWHVFAVPAAGML